VVAAATDGACSGNPGPGGWGALLRFEDGSVRELGGAAAQTPPNNRMELAAALAVLEELKQLPLHPDLQLRTDSRYLIDGLGKWMAGWKRKGWRTASGAPVLNKDLLGEALDRARPAGPWPPGSTCAATAAIPTTTAATPLPWPSPKGGNPPGLATGPAAATTKAAASPVDPAPAALAQLLSRLELADRLASGGYALRLPELAQLVELPLSRLEEKEEAWTWRDWQVSPAGEDRWRLERL